MKSSQIKSNQSVYTHDDKDKDKDKNHRWKKIENNNKSKHNNNKTIRLARMIRRMIKALRVKGANIIITIKLRIIGIARVITIIIRMRISAMTIEKQ